MARIATDPNYSSPTFPRATAGTDLFLKEDVQALAAAVSTHVHDGAGKGLAVAPGAATIPGSALTNGSVTLAKLAADSVDSSKIVDGTIATADLANASVTNAKLAADTARANLLTNGGFEVWQRGNGPFTSNGSFSADRWKCSGTQLTIARTTNPVDVNSTAAASIVVSAGGSIQYLVQDIEPKAQFGGSTVTFSIRVNTAIANKVRVYFYDGATEAWSPYHNGNGTWQTLTLTRTIAAAPTVLNFGVTWDANATGNYYLDNAMLVVGSVAADYAPLHPADDLARCLRYYEVIGGVASASPLLYGYGGASNQLYWPMSFAAAKAITPTMTKTGTWFVSNGGQPTVSNASRQGVSIGLLVTALGLVSCNPDSADDTVVAEANP